MTAIAVQQLGNAPAPVLPVHLVQKRLEIFRALPIGGLGTAGGPWPGSCSQIRSVLHSSRSVAPLLARPAKTTWRAAVGTVTSLFHPPPARRCAGAGSQPRAGYD